MRTSTWLVFLCLLAVACNGEKRRLQERLTMLDQQHVLLSRRVEDRRNRVRDAQQQLDRLSSNLTTYNTDVHAFIEGHRVAAECIRASRSTWGANNTFSNDVSNLTKFGAALCSMALLNDDFAQEVARVADKLGEADAHVKELKRQITAMERTIEAERAEMLRSETDMDQVAAEIATVRQQLEH